MMPSASQAPHAPAHAHAQAQVSRWLEESPFGGFHWKLFLLGFGAFALDGYCLIVYGAAVPLLLAPLHISLAQAGLIGSYALMGAAVGALTFGAVADRIGRRRTLILCIAIFSAGMAFSGLAGGAVAFSIGRVITGFGVGGCMPNMIALASEYAPRRSRSTMVSMMISGIQVGGVLAALLGLALFTPFGWRSVFIAGAVPVLLLPLFAKLLPDSPAHLIRRGQLQPLRQLLGEVRPAAGKALPDDSILAQPEAASPASHSSKLSVMAIFSDGRGFSTVMFWLVYFLNLYTIYGFTIWLPKLVMNQGYSLASGLTLLLTLSAVSVLGSFVAGRIADRWLGSRRTLLIFYVMAFLSIVATGYASSFWVLMICVSLAGAGFNGAQNCLNPYVAQFYPPHMRSTALGFCLGIGRLGSILGPALTGFLMSLNFSYHGTLLALALPGLIPAAAIFAVRARAE